MFSWQQLAEQFRQIVNTVIRTSLLRAGLTQYLSRCLEPFAKEDQETILRAMLALRDPETNQRVAEGLTAEELAEESGAETRLLKPQLDRLAQRDARLLETVMTQGDSSARYRLPHERLIPALYRMTGKLLAEVDQAKLKFENAFSIAGLSSLSKCRSLKKLTLDLHSSQVSNLEQLAKLTRLQRLSIEGATKAQRMLLRNIPAGLVELKF